MFRSLTDQVPAHELICGSCRSWRGGKAAADVVYAPNASDLGNALGRLNEALQYYELWSFDQPSSRIPNHELAVCQVQDRRPDRRA